MVLPIGGIIDRLGCQTVLAHLRTLGLIPKLRNHRLGALMNVIAEVFSSFSDRSRLVLDVPLVSH